MPIGELREAPTAGDAEMRKSAALHHYEAVPRSSPLETRARSSGVLRRPDWSITTSAFLALPL